jgi:RHS repeat-associated protein
VSHFLHRLLLLLLLAPALCLGRAQLHTSGCAGDIGASASTSAVYRDPCSDAAALDTAPATPARNETFSIDPASNRTAHSRTGAATWRYDNANQLTERGSITYGYDAAGNQTRKTDASLPEPQRTTTFEYDAFNRMSAVRDGAGTLIASYTYDPFDRRLSKTLGNGQRTNYLPSPWGLLAEADQAGGVKVVYGWSPQTENGTAPLFAKVPDASNTVSGTRYVYYHNDHQGTPQRITDKTGAIVWAADYDAFGRASVRTAAANAVSNPLRFPGQYFDQETGLHYNDRRYYDPDTGRYLSRDPIGFEGGINLYTYAAASPSNFTDPTGEIVPLLAVSAVRCVAINYGRCMALCMGVSLVGNALADCGPTSFGDIGKDCAISCLWDLLPIPNPCGKFGKLFSAAVGLASGLMNSFPADTMVHVRPANAGTTNAQAAQAELKPISELKEGDEVLAFAEWKEPGKRQTDSGDKLDERLSYEKITHVMSSTREQRLVHITLEGGERITATDGHPLKTPEGWRDAILLKKGGQLLLKGSGDADALALDASTRARNQQATATIADVRIETRTVQVFNLEVANAHTFFVGREGVLAHNAQGHHSDPKFLGGDPDQDLTKMRDSEHRRLHRDMNNHLDGYTKNGRSMRPTRGNCGADIREAFTRNERLRALSDFYSGVGAKFRAAASDFFSQHPRRRR